MQTHPLTKIQFLLALLWAISGITASYLEGNSAKILTFSSNIPFFAFSIITIRIGYLQVFKSQIIIYPNDVLALRIHKFFRGPIKSKQFYLKIWKPVRLKYIGVMNLITGLGCAFLSLYLFAVLVLD